MTGTEPPGAPAAPEPPEPPWALGGESVVGLAGGRGAGPAPPPGLAPVPGPVLVVANRFSDSPAGPYLEMAFAVPARLGLRLGFCVVTMAVDSPPSAEGGRRSWGFPKEVATLVWTAAGNERELRWVERDIVVRGAPLGPPLPFLVPLRFLQRRGDEPVVVPARLRGRARPGRLHVEVPAADPLAPLAGAHPALVVAGVELLVHPARRPPGRLSPMHAARGAVEPTA